MYQPLELLLLIAAVCTVADTFVPSLISVPKVGGTLQGEGKLLPTDECLEQGIPLGYSSLRSTPQKNLLLLLSAELRGYEMTRPDAQ